MSVDEYRQWRSAGVALHEKIRKLYVSGSIIDKAAKHMGLIVDKKIIHLDPDHQLDAFMECCLYLIKQNGMTAVERFIKEVTPADEQERILLAGLQQTQQNFYVIESVEANNHRFIAQGLFGASPVVITDINFSKSIEPGYVLYMRPIQLPALTMTSGCSFVFFPEKKEVIERLWHASWKTLSPLYKFSNIFSFNRGSGIPVITT